MADSESVRSLDHLAARRVAFVGIGGCGMSGLARLYRSRGCLVWGCDDAPSPVTDALAADGFTVDLDPASRSLPDDAALVVASAAIKPDHPMMLAATDKGVPTLTYPQGLGLAMADRTAVAIAGTHGKSTTSAMLGFALTQAGLDPSVIVGATCAQLSDDPAAAPAGYRLGASRVPTGPLEDRPGLLVAEACEYARSFHHLHPTIAAITSVEADHLDVYGSLDAIVDAFAEFARLLPPREEGGRLLIAHDGAHRLVITGRCGCAVETIGFTPDADYQLAVEASVPGTQRIVIMHRREVLAAFDLMLVGAHMAFDAAVALVLAYWCGADLAVAADALARFRGVDRRMHRLGELTFKDGIVPVYDDYGHHPTEIDLTLRALREHERPEERGGRLICVFQPHQHSRTRFLLEEFAQSFAHADMVIVPHIYFVRDSEAERQRVSAADLVDRLRTKGVRAMHLYPFDAIVDQLRETVRPGDTVVVMGAGPVWQIARSLLERGVSRDRAIA